MTDDILDHLLHLETVAAEDVRELRRKEQTYNGSWRRNGGIHAWHMIQRKIDRLQHMLRPLSASDRQNLLDEAQRLERGDRATPHGAMAALYRRAATAEDIFLLLQSDTSGQDGSVLAEVRDLRRYLLLVEAWLMARTSTPSSFGACTVSVPKELVRMDTASEVPRAVPAEDSNKHAPRNEDHRAGHYVENVGWKIEPMISSLLYSRIQNQALKGRFILTGKYALADRRLYSEPHREAAFARLPQTLSSSDYIRQPDWAKEIYEERSGVPGEYQLKLLFREAWGQ